MGTRGAGLRRWPVGLLLVAALAGCGADGSGGDASGTPPSAGSSASRGAGDDGRAGAGPRRQRTVVAYYVGRTPSGPRLFAGRRTVREPGSAAEAAVRTALATDPRDPDLSTALGVPIDDVRVTPGPPLTVDLPQSAVDGAEGLPDPAAQLALQAIVRTAAEAAGSRGPVRITVAGEEVPTLLGQDVSRPLPLASADSVLAPVSIVSPTEGQRVTSPVVVRGSAAAPEANVVWRLLEGRRVVDRGFATARECCTQSPYSFRVSPRPGTYVLEVSDTDESGGEGVGATTVTRTIRVVG